MNFVHHTKERFKLDDRKYFQTKSHTAFCKPNGFWISPSEGSDTWYDFCKAEEFNLDGLRVKYDVEIDLTNVLVIDTLKKFDDFEESYGKQLCDITKTSKVDWVSVCRKYSGILIAPYFWERRYRNWYYGWDCSSGCIWDTSILKLKEISTSKLLISKE